MDKFQLIDLEYIIRDINTNEEDGNIVFDFIGENTFTFYYISYKFIVWTKKYGHPLGSNVILICMDGIEECFKSNFTSKENFRDIVSDAIYSIGWDDEILNFDIINVSQI